MPKISQKLELRQQLTPQQVLQATLLQLNLPLLEQRILHELEVNPALELADLPDEIELEDQSITEEEDNGEEDELDEWDELLGDTEDFEIHQHKEKEEDKKEIPIIAQTSFSDNFLNQLRDCNANEHELKIAEEVLGNLDEQGYLTIEPMLISDRMQIEDDDVVNVMEKIQRLDPPGVASRNIQECLLAQAEVRDENPIAIEILKKYFDDFANHRYEKIIEQMGCEGDDLNEAMEFISRLNPSPRDDEFIAGNYTIIPDVSVEYRGNKLQVGVSEGTLPEIKISKKYLQMLQDYKDKPEVKKFVKQKVESANWFIDAIKGRKNTIQNVMEAIIKFQPDYFSSENRALRPMILKDVANEIEMDVSTVSRVTKGKYVQLPWEVKELKTFFSEGIITDTGKDVSNTVVKSKLQEIISTEDKINPIGDEELAKMLKDEGFKIARRTVTKYREQLKYPVARLRRKLN